MIRVCPFGPHYVNSQDLMKIVMHAYECIREFHESIPWAKRFVGEMPGIVDLTNQIANQEEPTYLKPHWKIIDV